MRKALAAESSSANLDLKMFPIDFIVAPLAWPAELPPDQVRVFINPRAYAAGIPAAGCLPWPGGRGVLLIPAPHERAMDFMTATAEAFWSEVAKVTPLAERLSAGLDFPGDFRRVQRPFGHAPQYVADGAAIVGDAAHPVSPAGGQGANASIWDALALAEVAHEALAAGDTSREKLARYELLRRPRNRASVGITEFVVRVLGGLPYVPGLSALIPAALRLVNVLPFVQAKAFGTFGTTFVTR
jgi:2-polyprenyl-6-methoxyphenol hydroxylase-like FAD-dependent oxidoreductase